MSVVVRVFYGLVGGGWEDWVCAAMTPDMKEVFSNKHKSAS